MSRVVIQLINAVKKYGGKAVNWVKNNAGAVLDWAARGLSIPDMVQNVKDLLGIK
ncbi:aureocin A53 family class IId bacteriocin [Staphylococcus edaphicus]|uniref:Aureocin A53 family class IId bacteriocin n=1 Tax=Staphylococcus edaphicus TaxID=1955013 RepID=A0ABY4QD69_9STAP|nr:aureocin A53 family class IId bacteriocin [Staphylococcus edaphicus]UQW81534.1 aureocin A53 family class IId bacteriocin [Staphylococcus edaphicus]